MFFTRLICKRRCFVDQVMAIEVFVQRQRIERAALVAIHRPEPAGVGVEVAGVEAVHLHIRTLLPAVEQQGFASSQRRIVSHFAAS